MTTDTTQPVTADSIKIALLENNEAIYTRMDKAIESSGAKITKSFDDKTEGFIGQLAELAKESGSLAAKVNALENWKTNLWVKVGGFSGSVGLIAGFIGYLLGGGHIGH